MAGRSVMKDPDRLFRRYRETRDPDLLAQVFDLVAPRLLRLAMHLSGDVAEAEDLVQATFLAAIERAETFRAKGEVTPWLLGILGKKTRYARRLAGRRVDPRRLVERLERTPLEEAAEVELSGALVRALDKLEKPYRQVLVLRLRHGFKAADIAHVLDESPGTVRVRIHRGMEKLRQHLPSGFAPALFLLEPAPRGLGLMRDAVLRHAHSVELVTAPTSLAIGTVLMTKKIALVTSAFTVALIASLWHPWMSSNDGVLPEAHVPENAQGLLPTTQTSEKPEPAQLIAPSLQETRSGVADIGQGVELRGVVLAAESGAPLKGALVSIHAQREITLGELKDEARDALVQDPVDGKVAFRGSWPQLASSEVSEAQRFDAQPLAVFARPVAGEVALASTRSSADGSFVLPVPRESGTLVCSLEGYTARIQPVPYPERAWTILLHASRELSGTVIDEHALPIETPLRLTLEGCVGSRWGVDDETGNLVETDAFEAWSVETEVGGAFRIEVPAVPLRASLQTPGYLLARESMSPFEVVTGEGLVLVVQRAPVLIVTDAETGAGVEHFLLIGREQTDGYAHWAGRFFAPGGHYPLVPDWDWFDKLRGQPFALTIWAEGYRERSLRFTDLTAEAVVEVRLGRGETPAIVGRVVEGSAPLAGAVVALEPRSPWEWEERGERSVDACVTDESGSFHVAGPAGDYSLRVRHGTHSFIESVTLPEDSQHVVDLGNLGRIVVSLFTTDGENPTGVSVAFGNRTGRDEWKQPDADGQIEFTSLSHGEYAMRVATNQSRYEIAEPYPESFNIAGPLDQEVVVVLSPRTPRHAVLITDPPKTPTSWRARRQAAEWVAVEADGTIPIDLLQMGWPRRLEIEGPMRTRWTCMLPNQPQDGHEIRIALEGARYEGVLIDFEDRPLVGVRISAFSGQDSGLALPSSVTDHEGRFSLPCGEAVPHTFRFNADAQAHAWDTFSTEFGACTFHALRSPSDDADWMEIRLPVLRAGTYGGLAQKHIRGKVVQVSSAAALPGARVVITCRLESPHGWLELAPLASNVMTGLDGTYEVPVPDVANYSAQVIPEAGRGEPFSERWDGHAGTDEVRDFALP